MRTRTAKRMHPAPSLLEAPPQTTPPQADPPPPAPPPQPDAPTLPEPRPDLLHAEARRSSRKRRAQSPELAVPDRLTPLRSLSPPGRKDTMSSTSTVASAETVATSYGTDHLSAGSSYSADHPTRSGAQLPSQAVFSVKDLQDPDGNRRPSRRRTGPLTPQQREKAALIRKLGACPDCRRRRVACDFNHHGISFEDAVRKFKSSPNSPLGGEYPPLMGRPMSPSGMGSHLGHDHHDMDMDAVQPSMQSLNRHPALRTPLPSGRTLDRVGSITLPAIDTIKTDFQSVAYTVMTSPDRNKYVAAQVLMLYWADETDPGVYPSIYELGRVLRDTYNYTFDIECIPTSADELHSPSRWLSRRIGHFVDDLDYKDRLKIVYYNGHAFVNEDRDMVLANSPDRSSAVTIKWSGIQQMLEDACSDTLILMDSAYYPSTSTMVRQRGMMELVAASASEDHVRRLDRSFFTRGITDVLQLRPMTPAISVAELHSRLLSLYSKMIRDRPEETGIGFPSPLHLQISGNSILPSIVLSAMKGPEALPDRTCDISLLLKLIDAGPESDRWVEWLRTAPDGIKEVRVERILLPMAHTFR